MLTKASLRRGRLSEKRGLVPWMRSEQEATGYRAWRPRRVGKQPCEMQVDREAEACVGFGK